MLRQGMRTFKFYVCISGTRCEQGGAGATPIGSPEGAAGAHQQDRRRQTQDAEQSAGQTQETTVRSYTCRPRTLCVVILTGFDSLIILENLFRNRKNTIQKLSKNIVSLDRTIVVNLNFLLKIYKWFIYVSK